MAKTMTGIAALTMGIMGSIFLFVGLVNALVLPEPGNLVGAVFALIGFAFLIMTIMLIRMNRKFEKKMMDAIVYGRKIEARIVEIKEITSISINRKHPFMIICEAEGRTFESEYFYHNVHRFDQKEFITVYVDDEHGDVFVDLES